MALAGLVTPAHAAVTSLGPTPYLSAADSPFAGVGFDYFHRETFEDHLLDACFERMQGPPPKLAFQFRGVDGISEVMAGSILVGHNVCGFDIPVLDAQGITAVE